MANAVFKTGTQVNVAVAGTRAQLSASSIDRVIVIYVSVLNANTGAAMFVGDVTVTAANGLVVVKNTTLEIRAPEGQYLDLQKIYIDGSSNNDKANISYLQLT